MARASSSLVVFWHTRFPRRATPRSHANFTRGDPAGLCLPACDSTCASHDDAPGARFSTFSFSGATEARARSDHDGGWPKFHEFFLGSFPTYLTTRQPFPISLTTTAHAHTMSQAISASASAARYDVTIYGATGFVGKLCIQHFVEHPQFTSGEFTWAIAGRSASKLEQVKREYKLPDSVGVIQADTQHEDRLADLARQSRVVLNLVGPYVQHGSAKLAALCVEHHTHYTDLSGETSYNMHLVEALHAKAKANGVVLAPSVGYDSLPPDLATYLGVRALRSLAAKRGIELAHVQALSGHFLQGGASGGTVASLRSISETAPWSMQATNANAMGGKMAAVAKQPLRFALHDPSTFYLPHYRKYGFRSPFGLHNSRTVYHSASLVDVEDSNERPLYGPTFQYIDVLSAAPPSARLPAFATLLIGTVVSLVMKSVFTLMRTSAFFRSLSEKYIPVGTGPSPKAQRNGFIEVETLVSGFAKTPTSHAARPDLAVQTSYIARNADPGYLMTSRVISEVSLLLAFKAKNGQQLPAGVRTGATIDADGLVDRLTKYAKIRIETKEVERYEQKVLPIGK